MTERHYRNLFLFKIQSPLAQGRVFGFHAQNLEVAELSEDSWLAVDASSKASNLTSLPLNFQEALSELNGWSSEVYEDESYEKESKIKALTINVTQICNLKCTYCAAGGDGSYGDPVVKISIEQTLPQLKYFLTQIPEGNKFSLNFLGGEPLLYPEAVEAIFKHVITISKERNLSPQFVMTTNGTLFTEKVIGLLSQMRAHVIVSLDGPPEINDKVRPNKKGEGATLTIVEGLKKLVTVKSQLGSLGISGVFDKHNMNIVKAFEFFRTLGADWYEFNYTHTDGDLNASEAYCSQMTLLAQKAFELGGEKELRKIKTFDHFIKRLDNQEKTHNYCGAGQSLFVIDARNNVYPCPWTIGNQSQKIGDKSGLFQDKLATYESSQIEQFNCQSCWARYLCGGGCAFVHRSAHAGKGHQVDKQFCDRIQHLIKTAILYYELIRK